MLSVLRVAAWLVPILSPPGWANGFPGGFSFQAVLAVGMTAYFSLLLMTAAVGVGAVVGFILAPSWESESSVDFESMAGGSCSHVPRS